jgi:hypothetical protein
MNPELGRPTSELLADQAATRAERTGRVARGYDVEDQNARLRNLNQALQSKPANDKAFRNR